MYSLFCYYILIFTKDLVIMLILYFYFYVGKYNKLCIVDILLLISNNQKFFSINVHIDNIYFILNYLDYTRVLINQLTDLQFLNIIIMT